MKIQLVVIIFLSGILALSCLHTKTPEAPGSGIAAENGLYEQGQYGYDLLFLKKHSEPVELVIGNSRLVVAPEFQGRVMTSSSDGMTGFSYGWINYSLISSSEIKEHINPYGGEERIWLGPEGGQFSVFFKQGSPFNLDNWYVPAGLDHEPFDVVDKDDKSITLSKKIRFENYSGTRLETQITRKVTILDSGEVRIKSGINAKGSLKVVAYQSENRLKNIGSGTWDKKGGALSVWMLNILNPSPVVTIIIPYKKEGKGNIVTDYFGKIPEDRLKVTDNAVFFLGDGNFRSKIGISPQRALPVIGSYDAANNILTIVEFTLPENNSDYVNSLLEIQNEPFKGDVINSYNDGPATDGTQQGPFYELEVSSPAAFLKPGEELVHVQRTFHMQGSEEDIEFYAKSFLNVSIGEIKQVFKK